MTISICGSLTHFQQMADARKELIDAGHEVLMPHTAEEILEGRVTLEEVDSYKKEVKETGNLAERKHSLIVGHFKKIERSDAILVVNFEKNGIDNYIGGNTLMEIAVAIGLDKKIFLQNPIPEVGYKDEIVGSLPVVINGDFSAIL